MQTFPKGISGIPVSVQFTIVIEKLGVISLLEMDSNDPFCDDEWINSIQK
jgi:hypothetical protein